MTGERCPCCETCACCGCNAADLRARLALAESALVAADEVVRISDRNHEAWNRYKADRLALQAFDRATNPETERGTPVANAQETAAEAGKPAGW